MAQRSPSFLVSAVLSAVCVLASAGCADRGIGADAPESPEIHASAAGIERVETAPVVSPEALAAAEARRRKSLHLIEERAYGELHVRRRTEAPRRIGLGHERVGELVHLLGRGPVAVVAHHTSFLQADLLDTPVHLVDTLVALGIPVKRVFAPEHGFRGDRAYGDHVEDGVDPRTGLPVFSLHGEYRKPTPAMLDSIRTVVFDLQDVGARFYTYVSTLALVMEACAEQGVALVVLDRPNPHGHHLAGPVLDTAFKSFVGALPVPLLHGMTVGELARMINGEGWLPGGITCELEVIPCRNYAHSDRWYPPIPPSPNLPTDTAIALYPSLCLFEATVVSVGRGTPIPFQCIGAPDPVTGDFRFVPEPIPGVAPTPLHQGVACFGENLSAVGGAWTRSARGFDLGYLFAYRDLWECVGDTARPRFVTSTSFFDRLAGTNTLRIALESGGSCDELTEAWTAELWAFAERRARYLLYPVQR